jgi:hypothetical protein
MIRTGHVGCRLHTTADSQRRQDDERTDSAEPRKSEKQTLQHATDPARTFILTALNLPVIRHQYKTGDLEIQLAPVLARGLPSPALLGCLGSVRYLMQYSDIRIVHTENTYYLRPIEP